jgi:hypothetical protein
LMSRSTSAPVCGHTNCLSTLPLPTRRHGAPSGRVWPWWIWLEAKPAIRHRQHGAAAGALVDQLRSDRPHRGIRHGPAKRPPAHALFHRGHIEIFNHKAAVGARQLGGQLMGGFPPQMHTPAIEAHELGFRLMPSPRTRYTAGQLSTSPAPGGERGRIRILSQGFGAGGRVDRSDRRRRANPQIHPGPHRRLGNRGRGGGSAQRVADRNEQPAPPLGQGHVQDARMARGDVTLHPASVLRGP